MCIRDRSLYDDYAHHPNEIKETIKLGRLFIDQKCNNGFKKSRLIAIFQPHRYSRVKKFTKEFAEELAKADVIYVTNIYGAGERNKDKINIWMYIFILGSYIAWIDKINIYNFIL